jgi:hypothetical protein
MEISKRAAANSFGASLKDDHIPETRCLVER